MSKSLFSFLLFYLSWSTTFSQTAERVTITSITPSENTGQDYTPWLNDDLTSLVQPKWGTNIKYIDVTLTLSKKVKLSKLTLYDGQGSFPEQPDSIYALNGSQKTLIGIFNGNTYNQFIDINVDSSIVATAIVIHKYGNNIPQKVKVYGYEIKTLERINISSITPSENTGQDYTPWLNDDLTSQVQPKWGTNIKYIDVTLNLSKKVTLSKLTFYDGQGSFPEQPDSIYALNGSQKTFIGIFNGTTYNQFVDLNVSSSIVATAIVIHKYGNNIPQKVKIYGYDTGETVRASSTINFAALPAKTAGGAAFSLVATSTNNEVPVVFQSSDPSVVSVSNSTGTWMATILKVGTVNITASQAGNANFNPATNVERTLIVNPAAPVAVGQRISIAAITPSEDTGQDYTPWLNDDLTSLVQPKWANNDKYIDVTLTLSKKVKLTKLTLYDGQSSFPEQPDSIYALNGSQKTLIGTFNGNTYNQFVDINVDSSIVATAIVIHKYGNNIPQKIKVYGFEVKTLERINIASIFPSEDTGQDYTPWLNDDLTSLVQPKWVNNNKYIDVTLTLSKKVNLSKLKLYDGQGSFPEQPDSIYALNGSQKTLIGTFNGNTYNQFVDIDVDSSIVATAIVIHKYANNFPQKVQIYGYAISEIVLANSIIDFAALPAKITTDVPFNLVASSTNNEVPVVFQSSDPAVVSVSNSTGTWKATIHKEGTITITASQGGNSNFSPAISVQRALSISKPVILNRISIAAIIPAEDTGQDYSPWLNDDLDSLVQPKWGKNEKYIDVTLLLDSTSKISKISFFDGPGLFTEMPDSIYALHDTQKTFLGTFNGSSYMGYVDLNINPSIIANGIVIRKYGNNLPQKIKVFGETLPASDTLKLNSIVSFAAISAKSTIDTPFELAATSSNNQEPIVLQSSDPSILTVSNSTGIWKATILKEGSVNITASQSGNNAFFTAVPVMRNLVITKSTTAPPPVVITAPKIPIDWKRWYHMNNGIHFDELTDGMASTEINTHGIGTILPVYESYYPLQPGEEIAIKAIKFFDGFGSESDSTKYFKLSVINEAWERIPLATFNGSQYMSWVGPYPNRSNTFYLDTVITNARYLLITAGGKFPTEMELYGTYKAGTGPTEAVKKSVKLRDMFAVNAFEWDFEDPLTIQINPNKLKAIKSFTGIRHYLDWKQLEWEEGRYTYNPTRNGGWDYDLMYEACKANNIDVLACIKEIPAWMVQTYPSDMQSYGNENVPVKYGNDINIPASYIEQAKMGFQFAARYGNNRNVSPSLISVNSTPRWNFDPVNAAKIGMGLIKYIECDNERDKTWRGVKAYQTGRQHAANLSAFYDGHKNTMGPGVGVKNADPDMKVVMSGLATDRTDYIQGMVDWCKEFRGYNADSTVNICWDVINYHAYSNDAASSQSGGNARGAAPEIGQLHKVAQNFRQKSHEFSNDVEVWVTETGYDLNQGSDLRAIPIGSKSAELVQADWILRTSLLYAREGVSRCFFYQTYDQYSSSGTRFNSSGLLNGNDNTRKAAADYLFQVNKLFGEYKHKETLHADPYVDRYELNGKSMYALVVPDEVDRKVNYSLNLAGSDSAYVYTPKAKSDTMTVEKIKLTDGQLPLLVTETPVFVVGIEAPREHNHFTWTGAVSTATDEKGNWINTISGSTTQLPDEKSSIKIPGGLSRYPVMSSVYALHDITIEQGGSLNLNGYNLTLPGNLLNNGSILDNNNPLSSITFNGSDTTQTYTGNQVQSSAKVGRLLIENPYGVSLNGDSVDVYDYVKVSKGNLASNGFLNLKATGTSFASILSLPAGSLVTGDVNVEVYFTGGNSSYRDYRMIATPVNDSLIVGPKSLEQLKKHIVITGQGGVTNGFDPGDLSQPYATTLSRYYEPATNAQPSLITINSIYETLSPGKGMLLFYRGDRTGYTPETASSSNKVNSPFAVPENTIVKYSGPINSGNIQVPLSFTYYGGEENYNGYNMVGNPYPCAINWKKLIKNNLKDFISIIKPGGGSATYSNGVTSNAGQINLQYIQPGQAFYIQANSQTSSLTFTEASKVSGISFVGRLMNTSKDEIALEDVTSPAIKSDSQPKLLRLNLSDGAISEETVIAMNKTNSALYKSTDGDAGYLGMNSVYLSSLTADGKNMTINFMPEPDKSGDVKLNVNAEKSGTVSLDFTEVPAYDQYTLILRDKYLGTNMKLVSGSHYEFSIDKSNSSTYGASRFVISSEPVTESNTLKVKDGTVSNVSIYPNPTDDKITVEVDAQFSKTQILVYDLGGKLLKTKITTSVKTIVDVNELASNTYLILVKDLTTNTIISRAKFVKN